MHKLKFIVISLGIILVVGFIFVSVATIYKISAKKSRSNCNTTDIILPFNKKNLQKIHVNKNEIIIHLKEKILILDRCGRIKNKITFQKP